MKTTFYSLIITSLIVALSMLCSIGCVVTEVKETYTDAKGHQVERVTTTKVTDPKAWDVASTAIVVAAKVRQEKTGPISKEEIQARAKSIVPTEKPITADK